VFVIIAVIVTVTAKPHLARVIEDYGILRLQGRACHFICKANASVARAFWRLFALS